MFILLVATAWLILVALGLALCRLAARSDSVHAAAIDDWLSGWHPGDDALLAAGPGAARSTPSGGGRRATG